MKHIYDPCVQQSAAHRQTSIKRRFNITEWSGLPQPLFCFHHSQYKYIPDQNFLGLLRNVLILSICFLSDSEMYIARDNRVKIHLGS